MVYSSINIQGNIISSEILDKIRTDENFHHQKPEAFGLARGASLRDEIGMAWAILRTHYQTYHKRLEMLPAGDTGTSLTREKWIVPLLTELGYETGKQLRQEINGKSYAISHGASNRGMLPIHIMGFNDDLDRRRETGGPRLSPHALAQEYLNNTEHLFALVTNGKQLRLLRDATRLVRMSYLEFDLERMMEEELYADFSIMYRVLHASRMPANMDEGTESIIEFYHQESLASGSRIREKLSEAVEGSIKTLANGFLSHPQNESLTQLFADKRLTADQYYLYQLRLVYRILFLIVLEERKLVYPSNRDEDTDRLRKIYFNFYSIERLRKLAENRVYVDADKHDLWQSLKATFLLFENENLGQKLAIKPLGSGLFAPGAIGILDRLEMTNGKLLAVLRKLTTFYSEQGQLVRVNYSDLDVEEFGSVYEGLLEYDPSVQQIGSTWEFSFVEGDKRSRSGSHYTPEELVKPLIKHSLDYIIEERLKNPEKYVTPEQLKSLPLGEVGGAALLSITVCDVACGSGHILLSAARRIAIELASIREGAEQPSPTYYRAAIRDVIKNCIYGVDLNPLAVELCKVALWLESHSPGEPLGFLDHHIKCGNSIVGLAHRDELEKGIADEAFKTLPGDDKDIARVLRDKNKQERKKLVGQQKIDYDADVNNRVEEVAVSYGQLTQMPEYTPDEVEAKARAYEKLTTGAGWLRLKQLADMQVAQFFIPKTEEHQYHLLTDGDYRTWLNGKNQILGQAPAFATGTAQKNHFFHWFLEFPNIMQKGGFDCILGNPPFLGGLKISTNYGMYFLNWIHSCFYPTKGTSDFVAYFFRRIFTLIKEKGFQSLISTNTISQGDTREGSLDCILQQGGNINHAVRSMPWPGLAAVEISLVSICKGDWNDNIFLGSKKVKNITPYLDDSEPNENPFQLKQNEDLSFIGSYVLGKGFVLETKEVESLILKDSRNIDVLFPYLNGDDINTGSEQKPSRWVINFFDWPLRRYSSEEWHTVEEKEKNEILKRRKNNNFIEFAPPKYDKQVATDYPDCIEIIEKKVKPERDRLVGNPTADDRRKRWWQFARQTLALYSAIAKLNQFMVISRVTKNALFSFQNQRLIGSEAIVIIALENFKSFSFLNSTIHDLWAWKNSSTMGGSTLRYSGSEAFETFPFPKNLSPELEQKLETIGETYHEHRRQLMLKMQLGLTKTYNAFHAKEIRDTSIKTQDLETFDKKTIEKKYGKEVWNLWNHLQKAEGTCTFEEAVQGIVELRQLHKQMDEAVLEAYGWSCHPLAQCHPERSEGSPGIVLRHDFYEVDYLPENDRIRYTIHPDARKEILKRLLLLNHERYEEEIHQGLHKKKNVEKFYAEKGLPVPVGTQYSDKKTKAYPKAKSNPGTASEPEQGYGQGRLF